MSYPQNSAFIKLATGEYPRLEGDIRRDHPEIPETATWPNFPCPPTYAVVPWEDPPEHNRETHCALEQAPKLVDGQWKIQWLVRPYTQAELDQLAAMAALAEAAPPPVADFEITPETAIDLEDLPYTPEITTTPINP